MRRQQTKEWPGGCHPHRPGSRRDESITRPRIKYAAPVLPEPLPADEAATTLTVADLAIGDRIEQLASCLSISDPGICINVHRLTEYLRCWRREARDGAQ